MAPDGLRGDEGGQLMILAAVLLVVGLIALAGMVGRVNQLGSQTAIESDKAILDEVVPLASALQDGIADLRGARSVTITARSASQITVSATTPLGEQDAGRHISSSSSCLPNGATISDVLSSTTALLSLAPTATCTARLGAVVTGVVTPASTLVRSCTSSLCLTTVPAFTAADVGLAITGTGIPPGAVITALSGTASSGLYPSVTISAASTASSVAVVELSIGPFALTSTSTPTIQAGVVGLLEHYQGIEASHGLALDYELRCPSPVATPLTAYAYAHLSDGTVWVEVQANVPFSVASCAQAADCPTPADGVSTILACG